MGNLFEILILCFFVLFTAYFPGRIIAEKIPSKREERIILSFALSFFLFYTFAFLSYIFNTNSTIFNGFFLLLFLILSLFFVLKRKIEFEEISFLKNFFIVFAILIFYQTLIPFYFGGLFYFDWFEHYLRSIFFLYRLPKNISFEGYIIPSRPPFFNIICFFYLSIIGGDFYKYQIISTFLNSMIILISYLFCKEYLKIENKNLFFMVSLIMILNPYTLRQITYTWTKAFCSFYIILGLYLYIKFLNDKNDLYLYLSGFFLGTGFIVHFAAGCYAVPIFVYHFLKTIKNRGSIKKLCLFYLIFFIVIFTYFSWSIKNYGLYYGLLSTNVYQQQKNLPLNYRIEKDFHNLVKTIYPFPSRRYAQIFSKSDFSFKLFNYLHSVYICTLPGSLTFTLTFLLLIFIFKNIKNFKLNSISSFLIFFFIFSFFLGLIVNPTKDLSGVAHTGFLPLVCLFLCYGINYAFTLKREYFLIFAFLFLFETIFILTLFTINFFSLSNPEKIINLVSSEKIDAFVLSNFLLKYYNKLIFLYDKFFAIK